MKKFLGLLLVLAACQPNSNNEEAGFPKSELIEQDLGYATVYGVKILDSSPEYAAKGYSVQLSIDEKVWFDTLYVELYPGDTLTSTSIFAEALVKENTKPEFRIESFDAQ